MQKTPIQTMLDEFTDIKYTMVIKRLKELLPVEEKMIIDIANDVDIQNCKTSNNLLTALKKKEVFYHDDNFGETYFKKNFQSNE